MDWSKFSFDYRYDSSSSDVPLLINIEAYKEAALNLVLPPDWRAQLDKLNRVRAIYGTTALEGNPLTEGEVSRQLELLDENPKKDEKKLAVEQLQIRNAGRAQAWVMERFFPGADPVQLSDILAMHEMITQGSDTDHNEPGKLRTFSVQVGSPDLGGIHYGAPHDELPDMMKEFTDCLKSRKMEEGLHPVVKALLAHFFLVTMHPFGDGNGRVSRLLEAGILFQNGYNIHGFYGLSNYFYKHEREYKMLLQECRRTQPFDVAPFIRFGLTGFSLELKGINNFVKTKLNRIVYRTMLVRAFNRRKSERRRLLNQREYNLLDFLLGTTEPTDPFSENPSRKVTYSELQESNYIKASYGRVTRRTFYRELMRLSSLGFIKFSKDERDKDGKEWIVELDFDAIGKY